MTPEAIALIKASYAERHGDAAPAGGALLRASCLPRRPTCGRCFPAI